MGSHANIKRQVGIVEKVEITIAASGGARILSSFLEYEARFVFGDVCEDSQWVEMLAEEGKAEFDDGAEGYADVCADLSVDDVEGEGRESGGGARIDVSIPNSMKGVGRFSYKLVSVESEGWRRSMVS